MLSPFFSNAVIVGNSMKYKDIP